MPDTPALRAEILVTAIVADRLPVVLKPVASGRDQRLGANGLGFDSVTVVEILLECERQFDMAFPPSLFDKGPLTVGRLIDHAAEGLTARETA